MLSKNLQQNLQRHDVVKILPCGRDIFLCKRVLSFWRFFHEYSYYVCFNYFILLYGTIFIFFASISHPLWSLTSCMKNVGTSYGVKFKPRFDECQDQTPWIMVNLKATATLLVLNLKYCGITSVNTMVVGAMATCVTSSSVNIYLSKGL